MSQQDKRPPVKTTILLRREQHAQMHELAGELGVSCAAVVALAIREKHDRDIKWKRARDKKRERKNGAEL